jgi:hypothetical protein
VHTRASEGKWQPQHACTNGCVAQREHRRYAAGATCTFQELLLLLVRILDTSPAAAAAAAAAEEFKAAEAATVLPSSGVSVTSSDQNAGTLRSMNC